MNTKTKSIIFSFVGAEIFAVLMFLFAGYQNLWGAVGFWIACLGWTHRGLIQLLGNK